MEKNKSAKWICAKIKNLQLFFQNGVEKSQLALPHPIEVPRELMQQSLSSDLGYGVLLCMVYIQLDEEGEV